MYICILYICIQCIYICAYTYTHIHRHTDIMHTCTWTHMDTHAYIYNNKKKIRKR